MTIERWNLVVLTLLSVTFIVQLVAGVFLEPKYDRLSTFLLFINALLWILSALAAVWFVAAG